jgi:hypothetical protein
LGEGSDDDRCIDHRGRSQVKAVGRLPLARPESRGDRGLGSVPGGASSGGGTRPASACYERFVKPVRWLLPAPEGGPIE